MDTEYENTHWHTCKIQLYHISFLGFCLHINFVTEEQMWHNADLYLYVKKNKKTTTFRIVNQEKIIIV